jgi:hypothetical protein
MSVISEMNDDIKSLEDQIGNLIDVVINLRHTLVDIGKLNSLGKTKEISDLIEKTINNI